MRKVVVLWPGKGNLGMGIERDLVRSRTFCYIRYVQWQGG